MREIEPCGIPGRPKCAIPDCCVVQRGMQNPAFPDVTVQVLIPGIEPRIPNRDLPATSGCGGTDQGLIYPEAKTKHRK